MIKVLHVCTDSLIGGAGRYLSYLLNNINTQEFDITLVVPKGSKVLDIIDSNIEIIEGDYEPDKSYDKNQYKYVKGLIKRLKPDIVHSHASLASRLAAKRCHVKNIVYTRHYVDDFYGNSLTGVKGKIKKIINNCLCTGVIAVAEECVPVLQRMGIAQKKITVITNGGKRLHHLEESERNRIKQNYGIVNDNTVITVLGRLSKEKGQEVFVETIKKVYEVNKNIRAIIAGDGPKAEEIRQQVVREGLQEVIIMRGFVENVEELLNITDIQVSTSHTEAQSLALIEGMSLGIPSVATAVGGNIGMIIDGVNGFKAEDNDSIGLSQHILKLIEDRALYEDISKNSRIRYEKYHTAEQMAKKTEEFYKKLKG